MLFGGFLFFYPAGSKSHRRGCIDGSRRLAAIAWGPQILLRGSVVRVRLRWDWARHRGVHWPTVAITCLAQLSASSVRLRQFWQIQPVMKSTELKKQSRCISAPSLTPTNLGMFYYDPLRLRSRGGLCACTILLCFSSTAPGTGSNEAAKAVMPSAWSCSVIASRSMPSSFRRHKSDSAFFNPFFLACFYNESPKLSNTNSLNLIYRAWHSQVLGRYEENQGA